jgi:hypothetical protein
MMCHRYSGFLESSDVTASVTFFTRNLTQPVVFFMGNPELGILVFNSLVSYGIWNLLVDGEKFVYLHSTATHILV